MTRLGARGATQKHFEKFLPPTRREDLGAFRSSSALWIQTGNSVLSDFLEQLHDSYNGDCLEADFKKDLSAARVLINNWLDPSVRETAYELNSEDQLILFNRILFKGRISQYLQRQKTPGDSPSLDFTGSYPYAENARFQMISLPVLSENDSGQKQEFELTLVVAQRPGSTNEFAKSLSLLEIAKLQQAQKPKLLQVEMPKLKVQNLHSLTPYFESSPLKQAFSSQANFSGIVKNRKQPVYISKIFQKISLSIEETTKPLPDISKTSAGEAANIDVFQATAKPVFFVLQKFSSNRILLMGLVESSANPIVQSTAQTKVKATTRPKAKTPQTL